MQAEPLRNHGVPPLVSVVIAAHDAERFVGHAIRAALAQRDVALEVIVADDASRDRTSEVVTAFADPRVRLVRLRANAGPGGARNAAVGEARGSWIAVLDADDGMEMGRLARLVGVAEVWEADVIADDLLIERDGHPTEPMFGAKRLPMVAPLQLEQLLAGSRVFGGRRDLGYVKPVFRRSFLERNALRYDPALRVGEDFDLLARTLAAGAVGAMVSVPGYRYRVRAESISHRLDAPRVRAMLAADERLARDHDLSAAARRALRRRRRSFRDALAFTLAVDGLKDGRVRDAMVELARRPSALPLFRMPIAARLPRIGRFATAGDGS